MMMGSPKAQHQAKQGAGMEKGLLEAPDVSWFLTDLRCLWDLVVSVS